MPKVKVWHGITNRHITTIMDLNPTTERVAPSPSSSSELLPDRHYLDFYESPFWFVTELMRFVPISGQVGECCSGHGAIANILRYYPQIQHVWTNDIDPNKDADHHLDASTPISWQVLPEADWIITNPPYGNEAPLVVNEAYKHAKCGIVMFLRLNFLEPCRNRIDFLVNSSPSRIISLPRYCFRRGSSTGKWQTDSVSIAAFCWEKSHQVGDTAIMFRDESTIKGFHRTPDQAPPLKEIVEIIAETPDLTDGMHEEKEKGSCIPEPTLESTGPLPSGTLRERDRTDRKDQQQWVYQYDVRDNDVRDNDVRDNDVCAIAPSNVSRWRKKTHYVPIGKVHLVRDAIAQKRGIKYIVEQVLGKQVIVYPTASTALDKPLLIDLCAGGGGVATGAKMAGIEPHIAVEFNPIKPEVSKEIADAHEANFPDCLTIRRRVQQVAAANFFDFPLHPAFLHASPSCTNFSIAKTNKGERTEDVSLAKAIASAIATLGPLNFTLENVSGYKTSESFKIINRTLEELNYKTLCEVVDFADYGVPQSRKRLIIKASKNSIPKLPAKQPLISWYQALSEIIPELPDATELLDGQWRSINSYLTNRTSQALLVGRMGRINKVKGYWLRDVSQPSPTILCSWFTDQKGASRGRFANIWLPDGPKQVTIECIRRLCTFPDWYKLPEKKAIAGAILGNSVPPLFVKQLFS